MYNGEEVDDSRDTDDGICVSVSCRILFWEYVDFCGSVCTPLILVKW